MSTPWVLMVAGENCSFHLEDARELHKQTETSLNWLGNVLDAMEDGDMEMVTGLHDATLRFMMIRDACDTFLEKVHADLLFKR
jgi:hypothetical protein